MANPSSNAAMPMSINDLASRFTNWISQQGAESARPSVVAQTIRPWESWELNEEFFGALSRWTFDNPETTLDRVLDNIRDGLENSKDLFNLIPENPFPARGLITALAHLVKIGISIRRAQKDVYDFAKDVVRWVGFVKSAFESAEDGKMARRAWRDLRHMRDLVNKLCLWAVERLTDGRWLRIGHGLTIQKEIREFNERISNARALFQDLSAINMARGLDALLLKMRNLFRNQQIIIAEIGEIRKTQKQQLDRIADELAMQREIAERERFFAKTLDVHAIASPTYDSQGKRPCDEDTRIEVLDEIRKWKNDIQRGAPNFLWLTGDPGCGKSAITASFARECNDEGVLWAQFFINRNNAETTDPRSYFPSIARQLADYSPEVAQNIHLTLVKQRSLTEDISANQAAQLFTKSIRKAAELDPDRPVVVVIDGLDETHRNRLEDTAKIFSTLFTTLEAYGNVKFFVSSRTENEIQKSFTLPLSNKHVKRVHLDTADPSSLRDVSHYIKRNLLDLVVKHDLNWDVWPGNDRSQTLGIRASGLFIWAVTAIKFIQEELDSHGEECLDEVLNMLTAEALHDINALYTLILEVTYRNRQDKWEFERFRRIVGPIVCLQEPLCIDDLSTLLNLRKSPSSKLADIAHFVRRFRTILVTGTEAIDGSTIPRIHKSVYEFITSYSVDTRFRVELVNAHYELAMQCLAQIGTVQGPFNEDVLPTSCRYACRFWSFHLSQAGQNPKSLVAHYSHRSSYRSPFKQVLSPSRGPPLLHYSARTSKMKMRTMAEKGFNIWDGINGLRLTHVAAINGIVLSPDGKDIVSWSKDGTIRVWDSANAEFRRKLVEYSSELYTVAISPDGNFIASGSGDGVICLWHYSTGASVWKLTQGNHNMPIVIAFSRDGNGIIAGWEDKTLILLNALTGETIGTPWTGHRARIADVVFSADQSVCSVDSHGGCFIWNVVTGQTIDSWKYSNDTDYNLFLTCMFSPNDDNIVVVSGSAGVEIRSYGRQWLITDSCRARCLSFSRDGKEIILGNYNSTIQVAAIGMDKQTTHIIRKGDAGLHPAECLVAFSPNWDSAYSYPNFSAWNHTVRVHKLQHNGTLLEAYSDQEDSHLINQERLTLALDDVIIAGYKDGSVTVWPIEDS